MLIPSFWHSTETLTLSDIFPRIHHRHHHLPQISLVGILVFFPTESKNLAAGFSGYSGLLLVKDFYCFLYLHFQLPKFSLLFFGEGQGARTLTIGRTTLLVVFNAEKMNPSREETELHSEIHHFAFLAV